MVLPVSIFFSLTEVAVRWRCQPAEIVQWALAEQITLSIAIPSTLCGDMTIQGLVEVGAASILPMFRRFGDVAKNARIRFIRQPGMDVWKPITNPPEGLLIQPDDVLVTASEAQRFEDEHDIFKRQGSTGPNFKYEWEEMLTHVALRIYHQGMPESQNEFINELQEWFIRRSKDGQAPDERSIRRRIKPIWQALREET